MKKIILIILICFAGFAYGQGQIEGNGKPYSYTMQLGSFDSIAIPRQFNGVVEIICGSASNSINVTIDDNLKDYFKVSLENGVLNIFSAPPQTNGYTWVKHSRISVITIYAGNLRGVSLGTNGMLTIAKVNQPSINLSNTANGDLYFNGSVQDIKIECPANGDTYLQGTAKQVNIYKEGNSSVDASKLVSKAVYVNAKGNGNITVNATTLRSNITEGNVDVRNVNRDRNTNR